MIVKCYPSVLSGTVAAIPSKSDAHRKLICAALSDNGGTLPLPPPFCDDIAATIRCLKAIGASFSQTEKGLEISPLIRQNKAYLDCGESGSTLRFLLPVAMAACEHISVTGSGRLPERPIQALLDAMSVHGVHFNSDRLPLEAGGALRGGQYAIAGNVSSQFLSGLLMALPLCEEDSEIQVTTALQSAAYVEMTLDTLREFGVKIHEETRSSLIHYFVQGKQRPHMPDRINVDGDWSNAAFWLTAGALQNNSSIVTVSGLNTNSTQGDKEILSILQRSGAKTSCEHDKLCVSRGQILAMNVSMETIPDLLPILAVYASFAEGDTVFTNAERLRLKESDRLHSVSEMLSSIGGQVEEKPDGITVHGGQLKGGEIDSQNDHRLVMAAAIAATRCSEPVKILHAEAVNKSYPTFFDDYIALGGKAEIC